MVPLDSKRAAALDQQERSILQAAKAIKARQRKERLRARPKKVLPTAEGQRKPRRRDAAFLAFLRRQPCSVAHLGDCEGPIEAAHIRFSRPGAPNPGLQAKSDDRRALSLCRRHHREGPASQHASGERRWWAAIGLDPDAIAAQLYAQFTAPTSGDQQPTEEG